MKICFFKCQKKRRNCKFGFSVVLYFFSIRTSFFQKFFRIFPKKYVFQPKKFLCTHFLAKIVSKKAEKTRTHEKNWKNVHFFKSTVSPLFLTLKKKNSQMTAIIYHFPSLVITLGKILTFCSFWKINECIFDADISKKLGCKIFPKKKLDSFCIHDHSILSKNQASWILFFS